MVTKILTPLRTPRVIGLAVYDWFNEKLLKVIKYLPTTLDEPYSSGMPEDPKNVVSLPFKPLSFNTERTEFYYYNLIHKVGINEIFKDDPNKFPNIFGARYKSVKNIWDIFTPINVFDPEARKIPRITWQGPANNPLSFYIEPFLKMRFLPDDVERWLYHRLGENYDADFMHLICSDLAGWLCIYGAIWGLRGIFGTSLISFNPYAWKPTAAILGLYEPWLDRLFKWFPKPWSLPAHYSFFFGALGNVERTLLRITFSGPFLPSEAVFKTETINNRSVEAVYFHGFPTMWKEVGSIPNFERLNWYERNPEVYDYIIKTYHDIIKDIIILPDHIIQ